MNIVARTQELLKAKLSENQRLWAGYGEAVLRHEAAIAGYRRLCRQPENLRFYVNIDSLGNRKLSIRFRGQDVGVLKVGSPCRLWISPELAQRNARWFEVHIPAGEYDWKSDARAKEFRRAFKDCARLHGHSLEHAYETRVLQELAKTARAGKFAGSLAGIQPVTIGGYPLQMPVPVAGVKGVPNAKSGGHIDIVARQRRDGQFQVDVAVLELKRPGEYEAVMAQSLIYATSIRFLLRDSMTGPLWWKAFGFSGRQPKQLRILAFSVFSEDCLEDHQREAAALLPDRKPIELEGDQLIAGFLAYSDGPGGLEISRRGLYAG